MGRILWLLAVGAALAVSTASRVEVWGDERALWLNAVQQAPDSPRPWVNLARQYALSGDIDRAEAANERAIWVAQARTYDDGRASVAFAWANLALIRWNRGDHQAAGQLIAQAHQRLPDEPAITKVYAWLTAPPE